MSSQDENKALVGRWFIEFWGKTCNLNVIDEIAAPDMLLKYFASSNARDRRFAKVKDLAGRKPQLERAGTRG